MDKENVIKWFEYDYLHRVGAYRKDCKQGCDACMPMHDGDDYCDIDMLCKVLAMLKEQEAVVKQWTKEIADNQLAHAPKDSHEFMSLNEHLDNEYKRGIWDGLQIAWNIISDGR